PTRRSSDLFTEQAAKVLTAQLIDVQAQVGPGFVRGFHRKNLRPVHAGCEQVGSNNRLANGAGVVENGDFHGLFLVVVLSVEREGLSWPSRRRASRSIRMSRIFRRSPGVWMLRGRPWMASRAGAVAGGALGGVAGAACGVVEAAGPVAADRWALRQRYSVMA